MGTTPTEVMAFPNIRAIVRDNGTAEVIVAGNSRIVPAGDSVQELRNNALALIVGEAQTLQRPVRVQIEDPEGHGELIVHPDNKIESVSYEPAPARRRAEAPRNHARRPSRRPSLIPSPLLHRSPWPLLQSPASSCHCSVGGRPAVAARPRRSRYRSGPATPEPQTAAAAS